MPRTELPSKQPDGSPNWVEWNDKVMYDVRFEVKASVVFETTVTSDGQAIQRSDGANEDRQWLALWAHVITNWSWADQGIPIPSQNAGGVDVIRSVMDLDDFPVLAEATDGLFEKVTASPTRRRNARPSSMS